jgi:MerR family glutamine synthetase transcriptional repressor
MRDEIRRNMPLFPIGIVTKLTELTPRQIRYYEQYGLIQPARTKGNQRLFSFNDIDLLLRIKALLEKGINLAGVKEVLKQPQQVPEAKKEAKRELSEHELRQILRRQLIHPDRPGQIPLTHGEMSRFFQH